MKRKVVVTGIGAVTPAGNNAREFCESLRQAKDGAAAITRFDAENFPVKTACEVKNFTLDAQTDPFVQFGVKAADEALKDSGLDAGSVDPYRFGLAVSSSKGGMTSLEKGDFQNYPPDLLNSHLSARYQSKGPMQCVIAACSTGTYALMEAARWIEQGDADFVLAGASDASVTKLMLAGYSQLGVYSKNGMCPYDSRRSGFLVGEGAGVAALELESQAKARGAKIYGEIAGYCMTQDAYRTTAFDPESDELCYLLRQLLKKADVKASDIQYFNTHGTSTREGDLYETEQIKKAFGRDAYGIAYSSTKSMLGHMLGASGAVEFIACLLAMKESFVPPTLHYKEPDPGCDLDYTPNKAVPKKIDLACSISMGFGGHMGGILVKKRG